MAVSRYAHRTSAAVRAVGTGRPAATRTIADALVSSAPQPQSGAVDLLAGSATMAWARSSPTGVVHAATTLGSAIDLFARGTAMPLAETAATVVIDALGGNRCAVQLFSGRASVP